MFHIPLFSSHWVAKWSTSSVKRLSTGNRWGRMSMLILQECTESIQLYKASNINLRARLENHYSFLLHLYWWLEVTQTVQEQKKNRPLVLGSFKFLIYGRRDEHYQACLDKQKVFWIELFDEIYFKEPFPSLFLWNCFLKEGRLHLTLALNGMD